MVHMWGASVLLVVLCWTYCEGRRYFGKGVLEEHYVPRFSPELVVKESIPSER